jgi:hypothetical protein
VRFCHDHVAIARERENGHWGDALAALRHNARSCRIASVACARTYAQLCISLHDSASALTSQRQLLHKVSSGHIEPDRRLGAAISKVGCADGGAQIIRLCATVDDLPSVEDRASGTSGDYIGLDNYDR